jgi:hypothetical protein
MTTKSGLLAAEHADWEKLKALAGRVTSVTSARDALLAEIHRLEQAAHPPPSPPPHFTRLHMFDDTQVGLIPPNPEAVAGYVDGQYANYGRMLAAFPHARHLGITISALGIQGRIIDCEQGDAAPDQVAAGIKRRLDAGVWRPGCYAGAGNWTIIRPQIITLGIPRSAYVEWLADWAYFPELLGGYDIQQYTNRALGRSLDESLALSTVWPG